LAVVLVRVPALEVSPVTLVGSQSVALVAVVEAESLSAEVVGSLHIGAVARIAEVAAAVVAKGIQSLEARRLLPDIRCTAAAEELDHSQAAARQMGVDFEVVVAVADHTEAGQRARRLRRLGTSSTQRT
jgi:hypothetical protein